MPWVIFVPLDCSVLVGLCGISLYLLHGKVKGCRFTRGVLIPGSEYAGLLVFDIDQ
jgi:hypothetical protein